jgi:3-methyl-2-oxobutanoate hydroxymethyltransferase
MQDLRAAAKSGSRVAMLTCYDYTSARLLEEAGVQMLLVGDSAGSVILGHPSTLPITLDFLITLTAAVRRGAPRSLVMGDMPFGSYHASDAQGVENVCRMVRETGCDCVKLEVAGSQLSLVQRLADAGVAVVAHLGLRPQTVGLLGGYRFQGKTASEARAIVDMCVQFSRAGASAILLEAVPDPVSARVVEETGIPVIGCGAGRSCHAHVVVLQDLLQQTPHRPKFVPDVKSGGGLIETARQYVSLIQSGAYPSKAHGYDMPADEQRAFLGKS